MSSIQLPEKTVAAEALETLPYPAFWLDEKRFIVYRNKASKMRSFHIRVRARIDTYVSGKTAKKICDMAVGEELFFDLTEDNCYGALIHRFETGYCVAIRTITAYMAKYVAELAMKMPLFFADENGRLRQPYTDNYVSKEEVAAVRLRYNRVLRYQNALAAYFAVTAGKLDRSGTVELTECIHPILETAVRFLRPNGVNLSVKTTEDKGVAKGSSSLIRFAVSILLSVAAENTTDGRIRAETRRLKDELAMTITFEPAMEDEAVKKLLGCYYGGKLLDSRYRDVCFDLLLVQMVTEKLGWKCAVTQAGCTDGLLSLALYIPLMEEAVPALRYPWDPSPLLEVAFSRLLFPEERESL